MPSEQLPLDFSSSYSERARRDNRRIHKARSKEISLFAPPANMDIHLHSASEAVANFSGDYDVCYMWLMSLVGPLRFIKSKSVAFPTRYLDRLLWVRPPAHVTLDAGSLAVARAMWAHSLGYKPMTIKKNGARVVASSDRWPEGLKVVDAPWTTIASLLKLSIPLNTHPTAMNLMKTKIRKEGIHVASAGLAGSAVVIKTSRPDLLESYGLPALAYMGDRSSGLFKMPLLNSRDLLTLPEIELSGDLRNVIQSLHRTPPRLKCSPDFPWTLYDFQERDAARAARVIEFTGGVLLAGEMGSGKTTIALALADSLNLWPLLVISPLSAFSTWSKQLTQMGKKHYLATETGAQAWAAIDDASYETIVLSYDRIHAFAEIIEHRAFGCIIADEVQRIRSPSSRRSRALRSLAASVPVRIGLSGTPLTNTVADLLPIGAFLAPSEWRPRASSKLLDDIYVGDPVLGVTEHLGSLMIRRRMVDTNTVLPARNDHRVYVSLSKDQVQALAALEQEARVETSKGEYQTSATRMHAFAKLGKMRQIVNSPASAGVSGPNPKVIAAIGLVEDFLTLGRKGVLFCADRATFRDLGERLTLAGIGWVGLWGATPPKQRLLNEKMFHEDENIKVVLCTIQAGSESWSASPTATWLISTAYMYAPATLSQMEARVYRMNSDPSGPEIEILYIHAQCDGGSLDDRMLSILESKKELFAQVVDRTSHVDSTKVHYSMSDLVYLLTGDSTASAASDANQQGSVADGTEQNLEMYDKVELDDFEVDEDNDESNDADDQWYSQESAT